MMREIQLTVIVYTCIYTCYNIISKREKEHINNILIYYILCIVITYPTSNNNCI